MISIEHLCLTVKTIFTFQFYSAPEWIFKPLSFFHNNGLLSSSDQIVEPVHVPVTVFVSLKFRSKFAEKLIINVTPIRD